MSNHHFSPPDPHWSELRRVRTLRLRLQGTLFNPDLIGTRSGPRSCESHESWQAHITEVREQTRRDNRQFLKECRLASPKQVERRISELQQRENELWAIVRPDLYSNIS